MMRISSSYTLEEVSSVDSPHLPGMNNWLAQVFPEYLPPSFNRLLANLRHANGRHEVQIFVGLVENQVAGLLQMFYGPWQNGLMADIDLLGVLEPYRRLGLAAALVKHALVAAQQMALHYELPALGVASLVDPQYTPVIRLHQKLGGQVRTDYVYTSGDIIVWYPLLDNLVAIETQALAGALEQCGQILRRGLGLGEQTVA